MSSLPRVYQKRIVMSAARMKEVRNDSSHVERVQRPNVGNMLPGSLAL